MRRGKKGREMKEEEREKEREEEEGPRGDICAPWESLSVADACSPRRTRVQEGQSAGSVHLRENHMSIRPPTSQEPTSLVAKRHPVRNPSALLWWPRGERAAGGAEGGGGRSQQRW